MDINNQIDKLISYGILTGLIEECDKIYVQNRLLALIKLDFYERTGSVCESVDELGEILTSITDFAVEKGLVRDSIIYRDMFDAAVMDVMTPCPSAVIKKFNNMYSVSAKEAQTISISYPVTATI